MNFNEKIIRFVKYSIKIINLVRKTATYMEIRTIKDIKVKIVEIREKIKVIDFSKYRNEVYGYESEYTYPILIAEVRNVLTELTTLVNNPDIFVKLSTYNERKQIEDYSNNILYNLESSSLWQYVDNIKIILRNYNVRDFSEHKIEFEKEIDSIRRIKVDLETILKQSKEIEQDIATKENEIQKELDNSKTKFTEISTTLEEFSDEVSKQKKLNSDLSFIKEIADKNSQDIKEYKIHAEANKDSIDTFIKSLQKKENKLAEVEGRIIKNNKQLEEYERERKRFLDEAEGLINSAKQALEYKTAEGLSAAFNSQYAKANNFWVLSLWIAGAIFCLMGAGFLGWHFMQSINENNQWFIILGRILLLPIPIMGAFFCANQYTKQKNIIEDYAYKQTIAKSVVGFSEQLKKNGKDEDNSEYVDYIRKALAEIHKDPLKSRKEEKQSLTNLKAGQLEKIIELAKKITELGKVGQ
jgi:hypothetical protein